MKWVDTIFVHAGPWGCHPHREATATSTKIPCWTQPQLQQDGDVAPNKQKSSGICQHNLNHHFAIILPSKKNQLLSSSDPHPETLFWHSFWHTIWKCIYIYKYVIYGIYIYIDIYYILILSDILDGICADILSGYNWHTFLAYILAFFLAFYLASFQAFYLASILRFYLAFYWHLFRHSFWHSVWHPSWHSICILSFYLAWVRVLAHSTASILGWRSGGMRQEVTQGDKEARRQGGKEWVAPLSKSRYPHVAGGEKETLSFNLKQNQKTQVQNT